MDIDVWLVPPDRPALRAALREVLAPHVGDAPVQVAADGRPFVEGDVEFSVSHTRTVGAIAVARGARLGVDVEALPSAERAQRVARAFPPDEARALAALSGDELRRRFLRHWTAKEAVAKAAGIGLQRAVREVVLDASGTALARPDGWTLHLLSVLPGGEALAVAAPVPGARIRVVAARY